MGSDERRVLVLGRRRGLEDALRRRGLPYALWVTRAPRTPLADVQVVVAPHARTREEVHDALARFGEGARFGHVIGAVESGVVTASLARRALRARRSPHSIAKRCHDKLLMKRRLREGGVAVTDFVALSDPEWRARCAELGLPLVVKERFSSGSRGVRFVQDLAEVEALDRAELMAERVVEGVEMSVESFVHEGRVLWTNPTAYWRPKFVNALPAPLASAQLEEVLDLNRRALEALAVRWGMTHLELFLTPAGPLVGEVALRPPGGYIMRCLELAYGFDPWEAFASVELGEVPTFPSGPPTPTAVLVLHPGPGRVRAIRGLAAVRARPGYVGSRLKVAAGDVIGERLGVGEDVGRVFVQAPDAARLDEEIRFVEEQLVIELEPRA